MSDIQGEEFYWLSDEEQADLIWRATVDGDESSDPNIGYTDQKIELDENGCDVRNF